MEALNSQCRGGRTMASMSKRGSLGRQTAASGSPSSRELGILGCGRTALGLGSDDRATQWHQARFEVLMQADKTLEHHTSPPSAKFTVVGPAPPQHGVSSQAWKGSRPFLSS